MATENAVCFGATVSGAFGAVPESWRDWTADSEAPPDFGLVEPLAVPAVAESAEAVIEDLDAPLAAAPAFVGGLRVADPDVGDAPTGSGSREATGPLVGVCRNQDTCPFIEDTVAVVGVSEGRAISVDEYAKAVLYNGLGHYQAARAAAQRACERDDFALLEAALAELVEASVRSGSRGCAVTALRRLEERAQGSGSEWAMGVAACSRALLADDGRAEGSYLEAIERLGGTRARVALGRVRLLYGEWLRRRGRRVDAREQLTLAYRVFGEVGLGGFAERARRELLATGHTVRKRTDDARLDLTAQEAQIAHLAAGGWTNSEIGERLFISARTVEWHLRKVFTKLGVSSRRELNDPHMTMFPNPEPHPTGAEPAEYIEAHHAAEPADRAVARIERRDVPTAHLDTQTRLNITRWAEEYITGLVENRHGDRHDVHAIIRDLHYLTNVIDAGRGASP
jgi:DNA-binding CsgD family transcriptional regulator